MCDFTLPPPTDEHTLYILATQCPRKQDRVLAVAHLFWLRSKPTAFKVAPNSRDAIARQNSTYQFSPTSVQDPSEAGTPSSSAGAGQDISLHAAIGIDAKSTASHLFHNIMFIRSVSEETASNVKQQRHSMVEEP